MISVIPENTVDLEKGCYNGFYFMQDFSKEDGIDRREQQAYMDQDMDEEELENMKLNDKIQRHWRMVFEDNYGDVYMNKKK